MVGTLISVLMVMVMVMAVCEDSRLGMRRLECE